MKKSLFVFCILSLVAVVKAQDTMMVDTIEKMKMTKNSVYLELLGNIAPFSMHFNRMIFSKGKKAIAFGGGISYWWFRKNNPEWNSLSFMRFKNLKEPEIIERTFIIPLRVDFLWGRKHFIGAGHGLTFTVNAGRKNFYASRMFSDMHLSYRYQRPTGGVFMQFGINFSVKIFDFKNEIIYHPNEGFLNPGLSFGYTF